MTSRLENIEALKQIDDTIKNNMSSNQLLLEYKNHSLDFLFDFANKNPEGFLLSDIAILSAKSNLNGQINLEAYANNDSFCKKLNDSYFPALKVVSGYLKENIDSMEKYNGLSGYKVIKQVFDTVESDENSLCDEIKKIMDNSIKGEELKRSIFVDIVPKLSEVINNLYAIDMMAKERLDVNEKEISRLESHLDSLNNSYYDTGLNINLVHRDIDPLIPYTKHKDYTGIYDQHIESFRRELSELNTKYSSLYKEIEETKTTLNKLKAIDSILSKI